ncbi:C-C chemokine receptor type 3-like [Gadus chalcogrammus]|uniref:C-C chemokine receptor type 3-like n=1 Tax=Gadus chalcogrammus TaxID=1042646 RepID=UPI0024C4A3D9|nr:C-C chemokine receptor type 3-like [Gadus chalcogrammus]
MNTSICTAFNHMRLINMFFHLPQVQAITMEYEDNYDDYEDKKYLDMLNNSENASYQSCDGGLVQHCFSANVNKFAAITPYFYYINFLLSYLGNWLVLFIIVKLEKVNSVTNIFLINLVTSNILFASSFPFLAKYHSSEWIFGTVLCKLVSSAHLIGFYSSILFLTLMTFDRYLAVVHAVSAAKSRKRAYAIGASLIVWFISVLASLNELVFKGVWKHSKHGLMCEETGYHADVVEQWNLVSYYMQFLLFFLLPLFMVMYCYTCITVRIMSTRMREKWRSVKLIFIIMITFFVCWTPYNIVILLKAIQISTTDDANRKCDQVEALNYALYVTRNIAFLYCCISPMFYSFVGKRLQSHFRKLLLKNMPCLARHFRPASLSSKSTAQRTSHTNDL